MPFSRGSSSPMYQTWVSALGGRFFTTIATWEAYIYNFIKLWSLSIKIREGNGTPLQYSCLENPMDRGAWWAAVHGVTEGWTWLSDFTFTFPFHALEKEMATHSSVLAWRIPGMGSRVGCHLWGRTESDTTEATQQQQQQAYLDHLFLYELWLIISFEQLVHFI